MKHLIVIFCIGLQLLLGTSAQAWSPVDIKPSYPGLNGQCLFVVAGSEDSEGTKSEEESEEEEEPDCD